MAPGGPWQFPADLHLVAWLDAMGFEVDVATDRELHDEGAALLERYNVVFTGSHPEYYSTEMLDAWEVYLAGGGRGMYLGSNGFYWVIGWHPQKRDLIEVRKGEYGSRAWQARPGEHYLAADRRAGGLWRGRARAPQKIFGVGLHRPRVRPFGLLRAAARRRRSRAARSSWRASGPRSRSATSGSSAAARPATSSIATTCRSGRRRTRGCSRDSEGHSDNYPHVGEDIYFNLPMLGGTMDFQVRADIMYFTTQNGGAVFSTSSIAWCGEPARQRLRQQRLAHDRERAAPVHGRRAASPARVASWDGISASPSGPW